MSAASAALRRTERAGMQSDAREFLSLIYDAALGTAGWSELASGLGVWLDGHAVMLFVYDGRSRQTEMLAASDAGIANRLGLFADVADRESQRHGRPGPALSVASRQPRGEPEWRSVLPDGGGSIAGRLVGTSPSRFMCIGWGPPEVGLPRTADVDARVEMVLPHLARAAEIDRRLHASAEQTRISEIILDRLPYAIVQLDRRGGVVRANRQALQLTQGRNGFTLSPAGLHATLEADDARLQDAISEALTSGNATVTRRLSVRRGTGGRPCSVLVTTLEPQLLATTPRTACLVFITDPEIQAGPSAEAVAEALGITPAEARVAAALANGVSLPDAAVRLGISINTARTLLSRAMARTGTNSQIALVRMVLTALTQLHEG